MDVMILATIVGLICNFRQERAGDRNLRYQHFLDWLGEHRHNELREQIATNAALSAEIDTLLKRDYEEILSQIGDVNRMLMDILARLDGFERVARVLGQEGALSAQAKELLAILCHSGSDSFGFWSPAIPDGPHVHFYPIEKSVSFEEFKFLEEDIEALVRFGLVRQSRDSEGMFQLTRGGQSFGNGLPKPATDLLRSPPDDRMQVF